MTELGESTPEFEATTKKEPSEEERTEQESCVEEMKFTGEQDTLPILKVVVGKKFAPLTTRIVPTFPAVGEMLEIED